jgi:hypothetical protein
MIKKKRLEPSNRFFYFVDVFSRKSKDRCANRLKIDKQRH